MKRFTLLIILTLMVLAVACDDSSVGSEPDPLMKTPRPDYSAENMALYFSNELTAPDLLYHQLHNELGLIERKYGDWIEKWNDSAAFGRVPREELGFEPAWIVSLVSLRVDSAAHFQMVRGEHEQLNALLDRYGGTYEPFPYPPLDSSVWWDYVSFSGRLNSKRLCEFFIGMDGVRNVHTPGGNPTFSIIMPVFDGGDHRYCYRVVPPNWEESPTLYYFAIRDGEAVFLDSINLWVSPIRPAWVDTVNQRLAEREADFFGWTRP